MFSWPQWEAGWSASSFIQKGFPAQSVVWCISLCLQVAERLCDYLCSIPWGYQLYVSESRYSIAMALSYYSLISAIVRQYFCFGELSTDGIQIKKEYNFSGCVCVCVHNAQNTWSVAMAPTLDSFKSRVKYSLCFFSFFLFSFLKLCNSTKCSISLQADEVYSFIQRTLHQLIV